MIGVIFRSATAFLIYSSYRYIGVGLATVVGFIYPAFTAIGGYIFFKKTVSKNRIISMIIAITGLSIASGQSGVGDHLGILLAVLSAIAYSGYLIGVKET